MFCEKKVIKQNHEGTMAGPGGESLNNGLWSLLLLPLDQLFFLRSSRIRVDLLSYERKTTDKREQYDWRAEKNSDGTCNALNRPTLILTNETVTTAFLERAPSFEAREAHRC